MCASLNEDVDRRDQSSRSRRTSICAGRRRGTAEIELILSVTILISILVLTVSAMRIGVARLDTVGQAVRDAFRDATVERNPRHTGDGELSPLEGIGSVRSGMPNRTHVRRAERKVAVNTGDTPMPDVTVGGKAGLAGPSWTFPAYPVGGGDRAETEGWFMDYVGESHDELTDPLRLAPAWTP